MTAGIKRESLAGRVFETLTVLSETTIRSGTYARRWICRCSCGNEKIVHQSNLISGNSTNCGCLKGKPRTTPAPPPVAGCAWIPLTRGQFALIDTSDYDRVSEYKWASLGRGRLFYASSHERGSNKNLPMHRLVLNAPKGMQVDHINCDGLDNRRANLRLCTTSQNCQNQRRQLGSTSGYKGVCWSRQDYCWIAYIKLNSVRRHLGSFDTAEKAAKAYDKAALELFGEFARPNFPIQ